MPQQIKMQIFDRNTYLQKNANNPQNNPGAMLKYFNTNILNSPMIDIVHNSKPGCRSCGH